ncbi:putative tartrate dehydrogenase/decarboxylase TtuC' [Pelotomaculum schinkii]|uniref:Putative tartrate dehydrogenase/decarboxylase TtuC n=1 Tax=Pelotomaculum schinkii TaxID=78350 RepID=A0A4Y7R7H8_9FIRM|nr:putative tartrate dehydrogenase/decarboxylase TtuC' [Pelotomaculum schinkii]
MLPGVMMLKHLGEMEAAGRIMAAVIKVLEEKKALTYDLGGSAGTSGMADAIIEAME